MSLYDILLPENHTIQRGMTSGHCVIHDYQGIILYKEHDLWSFCYTSGHYQGIIPYKGVKPQVIMYEVILFVYDDSLVVIYHTMT